MDNPNGTAGAVRCKKNEALLEVTIQDIEKQIKAGINDQAIVCDLRDDKKRSPSIIATAMARMGWGTERTVRAFYGKVADILPSK